jgi:YihY family inner membrane protein
MRRAGVSGSRRAGGVTSRPPRPAGEQPGETPDGAPVGGFRRLIERIDVAQQSFAPAAFVFGVIKKYGDDRGGSLSALITFYGLLSVFPLLLLFVTIAGIFLGNTHLEKTLVNSALAQFPVIGDELAANIHALSQGHPLAFIVSVIGLLWGSFGITNSLQQASARMWGVPRHREPSIALRLLRGLELLGVLALAVVLSSVLAGLSTIGAAHFGRHLVVLRVLSLVLAAVINIASYLLASRILAPKGTPTRVLVPGTVFGGIGWTMLQAFAGYLLGHELHRTTQLYGFFAYVLGLVLWLNLGSQLYLYATEINVVHAHHLWPRSLLEPPPKEEVRVLPVAAGPGTGR